LDARRNLIFEKSALDAHHDARAFFWALVRVFVTGRAEHRSVRLQFIALPTVGLGFARLQH
jgi:hypothetical protein